MRSSGDIISPKWMRFFQIVVGIACIGISMFILIGSKNLGLYSLIFLASSAFIIIGIERIVVGIKSTFLKRSSRLISIGIGIGLVIYFGSAYFAPVFISKLYVLMFGFGILATGALRIIDGIKDKTYSKDSKFAHIKQIMVNKMTKCNDQLKRGGMILSAQLYVHIDRIINNIFFYLLFFTFVILYHVL